VRAIRPCSLKGVGKEKSRDTLAGLVTRDSAGSAGTLKILEWGRVSDFNGSLHQLSALAIKRKKGPLSKSPSPQNAKGEFIEKT